eukprot:CAMPEP_0185020868 /NCGR_PEP_ID=MMETSP1103-20130426/3519_1 /TAXON_ID=36769 /ORGANISM="Paraphysomonas bandaiensis, Strain Caron Lab Isolate" /LENGTH=373 /DNA_ID=CAMNT_0027552041 /DNA_START=77 /DNA_END=1198 /DNA_ORIENTATION=+
MSSLLVPYLAVAFFSYTYAVEGLKCAEITYPRHNATLSPYHYIIPYASNDSHGYIYGLPNFSFEVIHLTATILECAKPACIEITNRSHIVGTVCDQEGFIKLAFRVNIGTYNVRVLSASNISNVYDTVKFHVVAKVSFSPPFNIYKHRSVNISVGRGTYGFTSRSILPYDDKMWELSIGSFCNIAPTVQFLLAQSDNHRYEDFSMMSFGSYKSTIRSHILQAGGSEDDFPPSVAGLESTRSGRKNRSIRIGHDVWIGLGSRIVNSVTIGHGAVIGAYSVVRFDVPPYAVVAGNPAQVLKYRFNESVISDLLNRVRWWDWDDAEILQHMPWNGTDIDGLLNYAKGRVVRPCQDCLSAVHYPGRIYELGNPYAYG